MKTATIRESLHYLISNNRGNELLNKFIYEVKDDKELGITFAVYDSEEDNAVFLESIKNEVDYIVNLNDLSEFLNYHGLKVEDKKFVANNYNGEIPVWGKIEVTVLMPVYNCELYVVEAVKSVLQQTYPYFELVIVDDGSTDNTLNIIEELNDPRIRIIKTNHSGIAHTLNVGMYEARGKYIIRMDADDIMLPNRIKDQLKYMSENECDICFGSFYIFNDKSPMILKTYTDGEIDDDICFGNITGKRTDFCHPSVIMKKESMLKLPYLYEEYFDCEDYRLWLLARQYGLVIHRSSIPVLQYRRNDNQLTKNNWVNIHKCGLRVSRIYNNLYQYHKSDLCVIIAFRNEGEELEKTLSSIRATSYNVDIMLIDDASDDGIDYKKVARMYGAKYTKNTSRLGSAVSKNNGIYNCDSKYWLLLDGHMRFYQMGWDVKLLDVLNSNENDLICLANWGMQYDHNNKVTYMQKYKPDNIPVYGGNIRFDKAGQDFVYNWAHTPIDRNKELKRIACIYGAAYAGSVQKYKNICGMDGIRLYGWEEQLMSIKWWMSGDKVYLYNEIVVGHKYRRISPNKNNSIDFAYNQFFLAWLFYDNETFENFCCEMEEFIGKVKVMYVKNAILKESNIKLKEYLYRNVFKHNFGYFLKINSLSMQEQMVTQKYIQLYNKYEN